MARLTSLVLACVLTATIGSVSHGANRGCHVNTYQHAAVVQAVIPTVAVYQTGAALEIKAAVEKALREREAVAFAQQQAAVRTYQQQQYQAGQQAQPAQHQPLQQAATGVLKTKCAQCHGSPNASAGGYWNMSDTLSPENFVKVTGIMTGKLPIPKGMENVVNSIKPEDKGTILEELFGMMNGPQQDYAASPVVSNPAARRSLYSDF